MFGKRRVGLPQPRQPLHPNRATVPPLRSTVPPLPLTVVVNSPIQRSDLPPSSPLPSPPSSPLTQQPKRSSTPPPTLSLQFLTPVVVDFSPPPSPPLTPPPVALPPIPIITPSVSPSPVTPPAVAPSFPTYPNAAREWTLSEILERCRTHAAYEHYRPSGYTGLVESWEVLDAAVRVRYSRHKDEGWEEAFNVAHRNKRRRAIE